MDLSLDVPSSPSVICTTTATLPLRSPFRVGSIHLITNVIARLHRSLNEKGRAKESARERLNTRAAHSHTRGGTRTPPNPPKQCFIVTRCLLMRSAFVFDTKTKCVGSLASRSRSPPRWPSLSPQLRDKKRSASRFVMAVASGALSPSRFLSAR